MKYDHLYLPADKEIVLHEDDPDLPIIRIPLPEPPEYSKIDGYGLHPKDQFFRHEEMPVRLQKLETDVHRHYGLKADEGVTVDQVYDYLTERKKDYIEEIKWIKKMIHRRYHGYWTFINGKPFYINRWYWFYLNQWWVDNDSRADGLPEFRDRDWIWWTANLWLYESTYAQYNFKVSFIKGGKKRERFFSTKKDAMIFLRSIEGINKRQAEKMLPFLYVAISGPEEGSFLVDKKIRTNYGLSYPKGRRDGATFRAQCNNYLITTEGQDKKGGIQSKSDVDSQSVFDEKLIKPWQRLWFFFRPYHDGGVTPKSALRMSKSSQKRNSFSKVEGLGSWIDHRQSGALAYDGEKMHFMHQDEVGKKDKGAKFDVIKRWQVARKCLSQGAGRKIVGWALLTSTTNKMEKEGGKEFFHICKSSMYNDRNENGQTSSGLVTIFIPAYIGLEGFVDKYGMTVVDTPDDPIEGVDGMIIDIGSRDYILNTRKDLEAKEDWEALNEEIRQAPIKYEECWRQSSSDSGFNLNILNERIQDLSMNPPKMITYDLDWKDNLFGGEVVMTENPEGRFRSSWLPHPQFRNRKSPNPITDHYEPAKVLGVVGADPFKFNKTQYNRKSNGAGAAFRIRDAQIDTDDKPMSEWESHRFTTTYNFRPESKDEYAEDMLKMCIFQGMMIYPEVNVPVIDEKFKEWGFSGYLLFYTDANGRMSVMSGRTSSEPVKQDIFSSWMRYINLHARHEKHQELLEECLRIGGPENMKDYDLFTAGGYALMGADLLENNYVDEEEQDNSIIQIFEEQTYQR